MMKTFLFPSVLSSFVLLSSAIAQDPAGSPATAITNSPPGVLTPPSIALENTWPTEATSRTMPAATNASGFRGSSVRSSHFEKALQVTKDGASGDFGILKVRFAPDPASPTPVQITTPSGRTMACRATFLAAYNTELDECYLIASITNTVGLIISPSHLLYTNAFDKIHADLEYEYGPHGNSLIQDVTLFENPVLPPWFKQEKTRLEVWTAWTDAAPVTVASRDVLLRPASAGVDAVMAQDQTPDFGSVRMAPGGRVFSLSSPAEEFPVAKIWARVPADKPSATGQETTASATTYLIESVDYLSLKPKLDRLPQPKPPGSAAAPTTGRSDLLRRLASAPPKSQGLARKPVLLAQAAARSSDAVVFDFALVCPIPVPAGIVSWWPANYDALDAMPAANDGTLLNGATFAPGKVGPAFSFDGTGNVEVPNSSSLNPTGGITLDAWVYVTGGQYTHRDIISKDGETSNRQYLLLVSSYNRFRAHVNVNNNFYYVDGTSTVALNTWYHVAMTYNGTNLVLYVNGVPQASGTITGTMITTTQPVRIGGGSPPGTSPFYFRGLIDEPDIFSRGLSATEIGAIYQAGIAGKINPNCVQAPEGILGWWPGDSNPFDVRGTNTAILLGSTNFVPGYVSSAFSFNGTNASGEVPDAPELNPDSLTIEAWVFNPETTWDHQDLVSKDGEGYDRQYLLTISEYNSFRAHVGIDEGMLWLDGYTYVEPGTWYHVAMTYDGIELTLYVNGQFDGSCTAWYGGPILPTTQPVRIGGGAPAGENPYRFAGTLDEVSIYNRALSGTEISALYSAGAAGKCKPAVVTIAATDATASEVGPDTGTFTITRTGGEQSAPLEVNFQSPSGTALNGTDYTALPASVTISGNAPSATVTLTPILDANTTEGNETAILTLQSSPTYSIGLPASATVTITNASAEDLAADPDYDGRTDAQELADGTDPRDPESYLPARLAYWNFDNTNSWTGDRGQAPICSSGAHGAASWNTNAVELNSTNSVCLVYRDTETNGLANINCRRGTVSFWFRPRWSSASTNNGTGPGTLATLIELGNTTNGYWGFQVDATGTNLCFLTQTNSFAITNATAAIRWVSNSWHQVVLCYTPDSSALFIDGSPVNTNGAGVTVYPDAGARASGMRIGSARDGLSRARGCFDELETFNYPLQPSGISSNYLSATTRDADGNGLPDLWEATYLGQVGVDPGADPDGDGLTNAEEFGLGTDPADVDTDHNGVSDADEDFDHDLLTNLMELRRYHTDPLRACSTVLNGITNTLPDAVAKLGGISNTDKRADTFADLTQTITDYGSDYFDLRIEPTTPGSRYLVLSSESLSDGYWAPERVVVGAQGQDYTTFRVYFGGRTDLYLITGSGEDADGDGLPNWYEVWCTHTETGTPDGQKDQDGDGLTNVQEYWSHTNPNASDSDHDGHPDNYDSDADGLPDAWELENFGGLAETAGGDCDADANTNFAEFSAGTDPNTIEFKVSFPKPRTKTAMVSGSLEIDGGRPSQVGVLVDSQDFASTAWQALPENNTLSVTLPGDGNHAIWVGLRGPGHASAATWKCERVIVDTVPLTLTFDSAGPGSPPSTVFSPTILLKGTANEGITKLHFGLGGNLTQEGTVLQMVPDPSGTGFSSSSFECRNVTLNPGANVVTVKAVDLAGNESINSRNVTFAPPPSVLPAPIVNWPPDNAEISGPDFMICGQVRDAAVSVVLLAEGQAPLQACVEPGTPACFVFKDVPLLLGTTTYNIRGIDLEGHTADACLHITKSTTDIQFTFNPDLVSDVYGSCSVDVSAVQVNGVSAAIDNPPQTWRAMKVPISLGCTPPLVVTVSRLSGGPPVYAVANPTFPPKLRWTAFSGAEDSTYFSADGSLYSSGHFAESWTSLTGGAKNWWSWAQNGLTFAPGETCYGQVHSSATYDAHDTMLSFDLSGVDAAYTMTIQILRQGAMRGLFYPFSLMWSFDEAWDFANLTAPMIEPTANEPKSRIALYNYQTTTELFTGGRKGECADTVLWFQLNARETPEDWSMESPPTFPIPAEQYELFGQKMLVEPYSDPTDPKRFTGHLIRTFPKFFTQDATASVTDCARYSTALSVAPVPLLILGDANFDSQITEADVPWKDRYPYGVLVRVNDDDDDGDLMPDNSDSVINGQDDASSLERLLIWPVTLPSVYALRLRLVEPTDAPNGVNAEDIVRIFDTDDYTHALPILGPGQSDCILSPSTAASGASIYVEGLVPNAGVRLLLEIIGPDGIVAGDAVQLRTLKMDLDVDSDNDRGYEMPDDELSEDWYEDNTDRPGKLLGVNDGDSDGDGIPGFADGFNWLGSSGDFLTSASDQFPQIVEKLPAFVVPSLARVRLTYDSSDPWAVTHSSDPPAPPVWKPGLGSLRIWKKAANRVRQASDASHPGDYVPGKVRDDQGQIIDESVVYLASDLGFSENQHEVTFFLEGVAASTSEADQEIKMELDIDGLDHWMPLDAVRVTVVKVSLDINRTGEGGTVSQDLEHPNGSVVQIVPANNPSALYPNGIFLTIPALTVEPASVAPLLSLKLKKIYPGSSPGKIRVYRKRANEQDYSVVMDSDPDQPVSSPLDPSQDFTPSACWKLDSTQGGVVDLALVAEKTEGGATVEICRDTVRISSIPVPPGNGRIIFVNPTSADPESPYDNFSHNAAHSIGEAIAAVQADDNILIAQGSYQVQGISVPSGCVIAGLAGRWTLANPDVAQYPASDHFDYTSLPLISNSEWTDSIPPFRANALSTGTLLCFGGVQFDQCWANNPAYRSGGAIFLQGPSSIPVRIAYCRFHSNFANDFGGSIFLSSISDASVDFCQFDHSTVECERFVVTFDRGMGGAIASIESTLVVSNSSFSDNKALVSSGAFAPPLGSAGGGGDMYVMNGHLTVRKSQLVNAVAGFPLATARDYTYSELTGDGGSILVHGRTSATSLEISSSRFVNPRSYGNGGAISLSFDSVPASRAYFVPELWGWQWPPVEPTPETLGGICSGGISNVVFASCMGGWQGGAVSVNGRGMLITFESCTFQGCEAGTTQNRDGKGGAISVCGGLQSAAEPLNNVLVRGCTIQGCSASGNAGGMYVTIRGKLLVDGCTIESCDALGTAGFPRTEGMGGAVHASAGGYATLRGNNVLIGNNAAASGGGLSVKSAKAFIEGSLSLFENCALGTATAGHGNGGAIFVTTSFYDDDPIPYPWNAPGWGAAALFEEHGYLESLAGSATLSANTANRWGGALYGGLSTEWYNPSDSNGPHDPVHVNFRDASIDGNVANTPSALGVLYPSQVAVERVRQRPGYPSPDPYLVFAGTSVTGTAGRDINYYSRQSAPPGSTPSSSLPVIFE